MKLPDLLAGKKFVAHYVMYTHDFFLEESIESVVPFVDLILIAQTTKPWFGKEVDLSQTNEILNKIKIKYADKIEIYKDEFVDEQTQRNFLISKSQGLGYDGAFIVDCDEIFIDDSFANIYEFISENKPKALIIPYLTFIKDASFVVGPPFEKGLFYIDLKNDVHFEWARKVSVECTIIENMIPTILHFSYLRENDNAILNKIKSFMHVHDTNWDDWYQKVYLNIRLDIKNFHPVWPEMWKSLDLFDSKRFPANLFAKLDQNNKFFYNRMIKDKNTIKLHLGCGNNIKEGYINIDLYNENADLKLDITDLSYFKSNSIDEIFMNEVFEHLYTFEQNKALTEWNRVLKEGGRLIINSTPDFDEIVKAYVNKVKGNTREVFDLDEVIRYIHGDYNKNNKVSQLHKDIFTKEKMNYLLEQNGFIIEKIESVCWLKESNPVNINIRAIKNIAVVETEEVENELVEAGKFDDFRKPEICLTFSKDDCDINSMDEIESGNQEFSKSKFEYNIPNKKLLQENYPPLTFKRINSFSDFEEYNNQMQREYLKRNAFEKALLSAEEHFQVQGICISCSKKVGFIVDYWNAYDTNEGKVPNWRERLVCPECNLNNRMRLSLHLIKELISDPLKQRVYISEQTTATYLKLRSIFGDVTGSEFLGPEVPPGFINNNGIRNEDFTKLSFADDKFDLVLSFDVFEHIYDYKDAFRESYRILKDCGSLIFSVPFDRNSRQNIKRAILNDDGTIEHILSPEYHGDPLNISEGCLCFYHFGWEMLDDLKNAGFKDVYSLFCYSKEYAYLGGDQIFFVAQKENREKDQSLSVEFLNSLIDEYNFNKVNTPDELEVRFQNLILSEDSRNVISILKYIIDEFQSSKLIKNKALYYLARSNYYDGNFSEAQKYFYQAIQVIPNDIYSLIYLGLISEKSNDFTEAIKIYSSCLKQQPKFDQLYDKIKSLSFDLPVSSKLEKLLLKFDNSNEFEKTVTPISPLISILILCYNKLEYTQKCLISLFDNTNYSNFEVIVVDNSSADDTSGYLETYGDKIKFIHSKINLGFVGGNNLAAEYANGEFLVFLNNDTEVNKDWLIHLYNTFVYHPDAGAVGSMLIYPDGKLQEAGSAIFKDGSGWNYGKGDYVTHSKYSFVREVDYCSGAALMVQKKLFESYGKFDEQFSPAYYEDTDLCFGIRKLGYKVYYCPFSKVIHHEGVTSGTDVTVGFKKYQNINALKFFNKWKTELQRQYNKNPEDIYLFSNRNCGKRILIIDDIPPLPDQSSGALRHYHILKQMISLGYMVTYVHLVGAKFKDKNSQSYLDEFRMQGVELIEFHYEHWYTIRNKPESQKIKEQLIQSLQLNYAKYDLIFIAFWFIAEYFVEIIRKIVPDTIILVDSVDIHFLRENRKAKISNQKDDYLQAKDTKKRELTIYNKADIVVTVTDGDKNELKKYLKTKPIFLLPNVHDPVAVNKTYSDRKDILFVGNFNHKPNIDAVLYFVDEIFPIVKKKEPELKFYVVGNNPPDEIKKLNCQDIIVTGWVPKIEPYLKNCRVSVVPLRFGAGMKGKVGESLSYGVPVVSTSIGSEGIGIVNNFHSFVSDDSSEFAEYVIRLYNDSETWAKFALNGKKLIDSKYSSINIRRRLEFIMKFETKESLTSSLALNSSGYPKISIVIPTFNQWKYTKQIIDSIEKHTDLDYEIIIVDNNSTDETLEKLETYNNVKVISNRVNEGFPKAVNQGFIEAVGDYVLLANNDIVVTENWLNRMVEVMDSDSEIGIVGPISNAVSGYQFDKDANYNSIAEMHKYSKIVKNKHKDKVISFPRVAFLCTLIKKEVIDIIGGLDERFSPGNYEDDDYCLRAQLAGYKTVIAEDVFIHHYGSKSFKTDGNGKYNKLLETNKQKFIDKWRATPDDIWLHGKNFNHNIELYYSLKKESAEEIFNKALKMINKEDYKSALEYLNECLNKFDEVENKNINKNQIIELKEKIYNMIDL